MNSSLCRALCHGAIILGFAFAGATARAQTTLAAGDIAVIAVQADDSDLIAMVALRDIEAGTTFSITDNGWRSSGGFRVGEGIYEYTLDEAVTAGTVFTYAPPPESMGFVQVSTAGDQIFLFQGTVNPSTGHFMGTLIWGAHSNEESWNASADTANASAQPPSLVGYSVAIPHVDNYAYSGPTDLTRDALIAALIDPANYETSDAERPAYPPVFMLAPSDAGVADAGHSDAGAIEDASSASDGGIGIVDAFVPQDSSVLFDAGHSDAGEAEDASAGPDASETDDASTEPDANATDDASTEPDSSTTLQDASLPGDASTPRADAEVDAGRVVSLPTEPSGCSCAVDGKDDASGAFGLAMLAFGLIVLRRRQ